MRENRRPTAAFGAFCRAAYLRRVMNTRPRAWEKTSDHAPVWIELGDKRRPAQ
ncbi:hypothetical protein V475_05065 [Sphingobium baderi LL03]|nr:hypothetical protein V475_05065 [Sphingobium baderi LL03]